MKCWFCNSELYWLNDFSYEDYGIDDREGIIAVLQCSNEDCNANFEGYLDINKGAVYESN